MTNDELDVRIQLMLRNLSTADRVKLRGKMQGVFKTGPEDRPSSDFEERFWERIRRYEADKAAAAQPPADSGAAHDPAKPEPPRRRLRKEE